MNPFRITAAPVLALALILAGCAGGEKTDESHKDNNAPGDTTGVKAKPKTLQADYGVHVEDKIVFMGALNDETGPAASIGKPYANGKRLLAAWINSGKSELLPKGWKLELVERDHAYNPQKSVQAYKEIKDKVLFFGTSFGTPNTLPLMKKLKDDDVVLFPASLSSEMAANEYTPPSGPSYKVEAMRAMDWAVAENPGKTIKAGIIYQQDDYGKDGLAGWKEAAAAAGVTIASEQTIAPGQKDFTAVISGLKKAGVSHVLLTTLPSATGPILGTAAQLKYMPVWLGNTPSWIDAFFNPEVIPAAVFSNFYWVSGFPYWGEKVPGMDKFVAAWDDHGKELGSADFYTLFSFVQGMLAIEAFRIALDRNDATRSGYRQALSKVNHFDAGGMLEPLDYSEVPFRTGIRTRVLKPDMANKSWTVAADYSAPALMAPVPGKAAPAENQAAPAEGEAAPAENQAAPVENQAAPAEDEAAPAEDEVAPAEDEAAPTEGEAAPATK